MIIDFQIIQFWNLNLHTFFHASHFCIRFSNGSRGPWALTSTPSGMTRIIFVVKRPGRRLSISQRKCATSRRPNSSSSTRCCSTNYIFCQSWIKLSRRQHLIRHDWKDAESMYFRLFLSIVRPKFELRSRSPRGVKRAHGHEHGGVSDDPTASSSQLKK